MRTDREPSFALRVTVSTLLILHFAAIGIAVLGSSSGRYSAPPLLAEGHDLLDPYLQPIFLGHSYRFFAPNPSVDPVLWARIRFADGKTATVEWPHLRDHGTPVAYTRDFSVPRGIARVDRGLVDRPATLSMESEVLVRSASRRLAQFVVGDTFPDRQRSVETIELYLIERQLPTPDQVRAAAKLPDLSLHSVIYLGRFTAAGKRIEASKLEGIPLDALLATIIEQDIKPSLNVTSSEPVPTAYSQRWPTLINVLLERKPDLFRLDSSELRTELKQLNSHSNPYSQLESHREH